MGVVLPALSLAFVHIAGDNIAVVPMMALLIGDSIYATVFFAYMIFGSIVAGLTAWIGIKSGKELAIVVKRLFGKSGKALMAVAVLAVSLPASSLTGGFFAGQLMENITGIPYFLTVPICIIACTSLAGGNGQELLRVSNYLALLFIPIIGFLVGSVLIESGNLLPEELVAGQINWPLVLALIGYNAGGMRSALVVEAGTYLADKDLRGVWLAVLAKCFEGLVTLMLAYVALTAGAKGIMPLPSVAEKVFGSWGSFVFNTSLLCILINTMVPAMLVNAKQLGYLTKLPFRPALVLAGIMVWMGSFVSLDVIMQMMSGAGLMMITFITWVALVLHKQESNKLQ